MQGTIAENPFETDSEVNFINHDNSNPSFVNNYSSNNSNDKNNQNKDKLKEHKARIRYKNSLAMLALCNNVNPS